MWFIRWTLMSWGLSWIQSAPLTPSPPSHCPCVSQHWIYLLWWVSFTVLRRKALDGALSPHAFMAEVCKDWAINLCSVGWSGSKIHGQISVNCKNCMERSQRRLSWSLQILTPHSCFLTVSISPASNELALFFLSLSLSLPYALWVPGMSCVDLLWNQSCKSNCPQVCPFLQGLELAKDAGTLS